ncbi:MAG: hypothetical protein LBD11_01740 [Candidatus Peribacteria bacterium]|jgi:hypothetical protein|nr:hypothetical protein [Candidatus Peribacteria bacterium]
MGKKIQRVGKFASSLVEKVVDEQLDKICNCVFSPLVLIGILIVEIALLCATVYIGHVCWEATSTALTIGMGLLGALTTVLIGIGALILGGFILAKRFMKKLLKHLCKKYLKTETIKNWIQTRIIEIGEKISQSLTSTESQQLQSELAELETLLKEKN